MLLSKNIKSYIKNNLPFWNYLRNIVSSLKFAKIQY